MSVGLFTNLQPASIEEKLQECENGNVQVQGVATVTFSRVQKLSSNQAESEEGVHGECHHLEHRQAAWSASKLHVPLAPNVPGWYLSVDEWDADPVIMEKQTALGSVLIQLL